MKVKVSSIRIHMVSRFKRDESGNYAKNDKGPYIQENVQGWNIVLAIFQSGHTNGTVSIDTSDPEVAAKYVLDQTYELTIG